MHSHGVQQRSTTWTFLAYPISIHALTRSATGAISASDTAHYGFQFMHSHGVQPQHLANML